MFRRYSIRNYNFKLIIYLIALTIIGILVIGSAKQDLQIKQIMGLILGLVGMTIISLIDYKFILKFAWILYAVDLIVLVLVLTNVGAAHKGAKRWIEIPGIDISFQPSELSKIILILFFAFFFQKYKEQINTLKILILSAILVGFPLVLVLKEPDLSTTIVTALIFVSLLFIAGLSYKIVIGGLAVAIPAFFVVLYLALQPDKSTLL